MINKQTRIRPLAFLALLALGLPALACSSPTMPRIPGDTEEEQDDDPDTGDNTALVIFTEDAVPV